MALLKTLFFGFLLSFSIPKSLPVHALHLSTFEMTLYIDHQFAAEYDFAAVKLRVFEDDLRDAIKNAYPDLPAVANGDFMVARRQEIERYFQEHLNLINAEKKCKVHFTHGHHEADMYWLEFYFIFPEKWKNCTLQADYLMELFDDQSNIGTVILNDEKQFFRFTQRDAIFQIALSN